MGILDAPPLNKFTAPVYSIRPTGLATHDVPEVQAAFADLPAGGGTILLPRGAQVELGTSTISWPINKPVHFIGPGIDAATIHYAGTDAGLDMQGTGNGAALLDTQAVRDCITGGFTIYGPNLTGQAGRGIRLNRTFRCDIIDVRAYGFANNTAPFGAGIYATSSFYLNIEKYQTWTPDRAIQSYAGLLIDAAQDGDPVFLATVKHSSLWGCKRGAVVIGNNILFEEVGFEQCSEFGATINSGVNIGFLNCWWESINSGAVGGTALRIGTTGSAPTGVWVRGSRFSSNIYAAIENHGRRGRFDHNAFKPTIPAPITEGTLAQNNVYDDNYWDDATGTALDTVVQTTQQGASPPGASISLLAGSGSVVKNAVTTDSMAQSVNDTTLVTAATAYALDSLSVTLPPGRYLLIANGLYAFTAAAQVTQHIYDGTAVVAESEVRGSTSQNFSLATQALVSPTATTTYTVRAMPSVSGSVVVAKKTGPDSGTANKASTLVAIRLG